MVASVRSASNPRHYLIICRLEKRVSGTAKRVEKELWIDDE
jgi:hypothetical protein